MNTLESNRYTEAWRAFGQSVPRPRAILVISAHWYVDGTAVTAMKQARRVEAKFTALVEPMIGAGRAEALKQRILALDSLTMAQCAPWPA